MLTEEALILLATLGASGLLVLGVAELAWPTKPRKRERRPRAPWTARVQPPVVPESVAPSSDELVDEAFEEPSAVEEAGVHEIADDAPVASPHATPAIATALSAPAVTDVTPLRATPTLATSPAATSSAPAASATTPPATAVARGGPSPEPEAPRPQVLPIDTCLAMYKDGRFAEVISLGSAALQVHARLAAVSGRPHEAAPLLDLVGLSKHELGDRDGAREAFREAVLDADPAERPTYVEPLVAVIEDAVEDSGGADGAGVVARTRELRACLAAIADALVDMPGDEVLTSAEIAVREALSSASEHLVARVVAGDADEDGRAVVAEILEDEAMPPAWRERVREQLAAASSAEIGQLTAQAIRSVQDGKDGEALEALERAERLASALPIGAVADERREEFERRLWWGYTKVGLRRVEVKSFDGALDPLFRAIRLGGVDEERLSETRAALVRAVEGVVETRWPAIQQLVVEDAHAAHAELEKLSALLRNATQRGLSRDDLADGFARVEHLEQVLVKADRP